MPGIAQSSTPTNPPAEAPNGISGFFSYLGQLAAPIVNATVAGAADKITAKTNASIQAMYNKNHLINPATGPNDTSAAQAAANRTFLEKFLPSSMLYDTDAETGAQSPSGFYYLIMGGLVLLLVLFLIRMFRR